MKNSQLVELIELLDEAYVPYRWMFVSVGDDRVCPECDAYSHDLWTRRGITVYFDYAQQVDDELILPSVHPNCLKEGTLIQLRRGKIPIDDVRIGDFVLTHKGRYMPVIQTHKNLYDGLIYKIGEEWLTGNHPVLTDKGWMIADRLHKGDNVLHPKPMSLEPENDPTIFGEKKVLPFVASNFLRKAMEISSINFNGKFCFRNSKVNIDDIEGILRDYRNFFGFEQFVEHGFQRREPGMQLNAFSICNEYFMNAFSMCNEHFMGFSRSSDFGVTSFNLMNPLLRRHLSPFELFSLTLSTPYNPCLEESISDYRAADFIPLGEGEFGKAFDGIESDQFLYGEGYISPNHCATTLTNIDRERYKGIIYNLSVLGDETYCIGEDNKIVHNCRCILVRGPPETESEGVGERLIAHEEIGLHDDYERIKKAFQKIYGLELGSKKFDDWIIQNKFDVLSSYVKRKR